MQDLVLFQSSSWKKNVNLSFSQNYGLEVGPFPGQDTTLKNPIWG